MKRVWTHKYYSEKIRRRLEHTEASRNWAEYYDTSASFTYI